MVTLGKSQMPLGCQWGLDLEIFCGLILTHHIMVGLSLAQAKRACRATGLTLFTEGIQLNCSYKKNMVLFLVCCRSNWYGHISGDALWVSKYTLPRSAWALGNYPSIHSVDGNNLVLMAEFVSSQQWKGVNFPATAVIGQDCCWKMSTLLSSGI